MNHLCNINGCAIFDDGVNVYSTYNAKLKIAGDSAKVTFYQSGISAGWKKNRRDLERPGDSARPEEPEKEYDPEERWQKTTRRARRDVYDRIATNLGRHRDHNGKRQRFKFVTYTFRDDVKDYKTANRMFDQGMERLNYHFAGKSGERFLRYVAVPQLQDGKRKDGSSDGRYVWHYHVVFFNLPYIPVSGDVVDHLIAEGRLQPDYDKRDTLFYLWGNGGVDIEAGKFSDDQHIAGYISRYIGKGLDGCYEYASEEGNLRRRRFLCSSGLFAPKIINALLNKEQRRSIFEYFARHCKHFKRKGGQDQEPERFFDTYQCESEYVGKIFGIDFRAPEKQLRLLERKFNQYNFGLC